MADIINDDEQIVDRILQSPDNFSVLGLTNTCSLKELKTAYRNLVLKVHPDKNKTSRANEAFKVFHKAYNTLKASLERQQYARIISWRSVLLEEQTGVPGENHRSAASHCQDSNTEGADLHSKPQRSTSSTYNEYHTDTDSTRQRTPRETDENNTYSFRKRTQFTPRRKAKTHKQSRDWVPYIAIFVWMVVIWYFLIHSNVPRKTQEQSGLSISKTFELQKTETFTVKMITKKLKIPFYVRTGYQPKSGDELLYLWETVEKASSIN